jgi:hypothetical protein
MAPKKSQRKIESKSKQANDPISYKGKGDNIQ